MAGWGGVGGKVLLAVATISLVLGPVFLTGSLFINFVRWALSFPFYR